MRSFKTNHRSKVAVAHRGLSLLTLLLICASGSVLFAQSGRKQTDADTASTNSVPAVRDNSNKQTPSPAFIVVTSAPHKFQSFRAQAGYSHPSNLEYQARGGCVLELKNIPGAKVSEDEDVARWEARDTALAEDKAWVIWMELSWDKATSTYDLTPFRLRYLLFEPGTGRIAASGVGNGVKQTWGKPQSLNSNLDEQLREAGRDIAAQVLSELRIRP